MKLFLAKLHHPYPDLLYIKGGSRMEKIESKKLTFSCGVKGCCPTVHVDGEKVSIVDDCDKTIDMTRTQLLALAHRTIELVK